MLDKKAETRLSLNQSLFSFSEHEFYFVFPGPLHRYSCAMNIYVHHAYVNSRVYHSRLTTKHLVISTTTIAIVRKVFNFSVTLVV